MARRLWAHALVTVLATSSAVRPGRAAEPGVSIETIAQASGRPGECGRGAGEGADRWARARLPGLGQYCEGVRQATTLLAASPEAAIRAARAAAKALPGRAAPLVLEARALLRLGSKDEAWAAFESARAMDSRSLESAPTLADYARCAMRTAHRNEAVRAYRDLAVRAPLLESGGPRVRALLEAAELISSLGPEHLSEAVSYLAEARKQPSIPGLADYVLGAMALMLDRQGRVTESRMVASEASGPWQLADVDEKGGAGPALAPDLPPGELDAIVATLAEGRDRELAAERWAAFLEHGKSAPEPYRERARAHRDASGRGRNR